MKDMSERDLLPKNMMKVPEVFTILSIIIQRRGGRGKGERREGREERRGREYIFSVLSQCLPVFVVM